MESAEAAAGGVEGAVKDEVVEGGGALPRLVLISSSAGGGKSFVLSQIYAHLVKAQVHSFERLIRLIRVGWLGSQIYVHLAHAQAAQLYAPPPPSLHRHSLHRPSLH